VLFPAEKKRYQKKQQTCGLIAFESVFMAIVHIAPYSMYAEGEFSALNHGGRTIDLNALCVRTPDDRRLKRTQTVFLKQLHQRSTRSLPCEPASILTYYSSTE
jgi:hypothetical protein